MKPRNLWNQETYEITKSMKPQTYETKKTTKRLKPRHLWNQETLETTKPMKARNLQSTKPMKPKIFLTFRFSVFTQEIYSMNFKSSPFRIFIFLYLPLLFYVIYCVRYTK